MNYGWRKMSNGERTFHVINYIFLGIISIIALYPFIYVLSASISSPRNVLSGQVILLPKDIMFDSYKQVLSDKSILIAYANTIFYTVFGTAISMFLSICGAYVLSKPHLHGRTFFAFFIAVTMWFGAGMIPSYLNIKSLGLLDNRWGILLPHAISVFNVILLRTFFQGLPKELEESASMDGASHWTILTKIYLPLSKAAIATVTMFYALSKWNGYFWPMVILRDENKVPLPVILKKLIVENSIGDEFSTAMNAATRVSSDTITFATIVVSILPVIIIYPFVQKYFVKGVMVGSIKG